MNSRPSVSDRCNSVYFKNKYLGECHETEQGRLSEAQPMHFTSMRSIDFDLVDFERASIM